MLLSDLTEPFVVEGRFISFIAAAGVIVMRATLFFRGGGSCGLQRYRLSLEIFHSAVCRPRGIPGGFNDIGFLIASLISSLNSRFTLIRQRSSLPFIIPLFLLSIHPWFLVMTADYIAVIFILIAFFPLLKSYQASDVNLYSFQSAILIGVASLSRSMRLCCFPCGGGES